MKRHQAVIVVLLALNGTLGGQTHPASGPGSAALITRLPPVERVARPDQPARLALPEVEALALDRNPAIARAALAVEGARGNWLQVGLPPNLRVGFGEQQLGSNGCAEQDNVTFSQEFVLGGKLRLSRDVAMKEVARAEQEFAVQRARVLSDVRIAFYTAVIAQEQRAVADELVQIARLGLQSAETKNQGDPTYRNDVLEARIELRTAEIAARQNANRHRAAWQNLAAVVGEPHLPPAELADSVDLVADQRDWAEVFQRLRTQSPEIAAAVMQIQRARALWRRASVEATPNVTVDALLNCATTESAATRTEGSRSLFPCRSSIATRAP